MSLRTGLVDDLCLQLDRGDLDIVIGPLDAETRTGRRTDVLARETVVLITELGHPATTLLGVRVEPFVCLPERSGLREILDAAARRAGFTPRVEFETRSAAAIRQLVSVGVGVALLAASAARGPGAPVRVHELRPSPRHPPIGIAEPAGRGLTPAAKAFRDELVRHRQ